VDIYREADTIDPDSEARKHGPGLWAKFQMERICANTADVFTTVSSITALEAEKFLGKKPDIILPNGLDIEKFPTLDQLNVRHNILKQKMDTYIMYHFFPYYQFDLENTLTYFVAGRYEFRDKGLDILIKSLADLNDKLKKEKCEKTVVMFFFVPAGVKGTKLSLLENRSHFFDMNDTVEEESLALKSKLTYLLLSNKKISKASLFSKDILNDLKVKTNRFKKSGTPPVVTHEMADPEHDPILQSLKTHNLKNSAEDRVKVVFYPIYLTGADGLLDTTYYESISAGNLGIFPSFYEPWGYTPLEASVHGVASVTSDVSGFGAYVTPQTQDKKIPGVFILNRLGKTPEEETNQLTQVLYDFLHLSRHERIENNISARKIAESCDWARFITHYITAHNLALSKKD
jgi:glycogen(starch) synthase